MEPGSYCEQLQKKLLELRELVEANSLEATTCQQSEYRSEEATKLTAGQKVLVTNPVRGKLDPQWTGPWIVVKRIDATNVKIKIGTREQVIHINRIRSLLKKDMTVGKPLTWAPPLFTYFSLDADDEKAIENDPITDDDRTVRTTRSGWEIRPVDYYGYQLIDFLCFCKNSFYGEMCNKCYYSFCIIIVVQLLNHVIIRC